MEAMPEQCISILYEAGNPLRAEQNALPKGYKCLIILGEMCLQIWVQTPSSLSSLLSKPTKQASPVNRAWAGTEELRDREQLQEGEGVSGDVLQWEMEGISWPFPCPQNQKLLGVPHVQFQVLSMGVGKLNQELAGWQKHE